MTVTVERTRNALASLAGLPAAGLPVETALDQVIRTADAVFDAGPNALLLIDDDQRLRALPATDPRADVLERASLASGDGPCLEALTRNTFVYSGDLAADRRWPAFRALAVPAGLRAVLATPIPNHAGPVGVLATVSDHHHPWLDVDARAAGAFADLAAQLLANALRVREQERVTRQLQHALDARVVIEQAKGMLVERHGIAPDEAFDRLRQAARRDRRRVADVAAELLAARLARTDPGTQV